MKDINKGIYLKKKKKKKIMSGVCVLVVDWSVNRSMITHECKEGNSSTILVGMGEEEKKKKRKKKEKKKKKKKNGNTTRAINHTEIEQVLTEDTLK